MATLNIDIDKATEKIEKELNLQPKTAAIMAKNLFNLHENLFPIIEGWLEGKCEDVEFNGITMSYIMKKEKTPFIDAVFSMSYLIENPDKIDFYKERTFDRK